MYPVTKPWNPGIWISNGRIQKDRALGWDEDLQTGNPLKVKPKDAQPVFQPIAGYPAKRKELI
ncbi:MAG TPA: hypothetical protein VJ731_06750 [Terriglobales bacterium]|nr:hypothetical protein [Terriglobales bacterium]